MDSEESIPLRDLGNSVFFICHFYPRTATSHLDQGYMHLPGRYRNSSANERLKPKLNMFQSFHISDAAANAKRRRNRQPKACQPCRQRKLRCDFTQPCQRCRQRGHEDICVYGKGSDGSKRTSVSTYQAISPDVVDSHTNTSPQSVHTFSTNSTQQPQHSERPTVIGDYERNLLSLLEPVPDLISQVCETEVETGEVLFFGRNSHLAFLNALILSSASNTDRSPLLPPSASLPSVLGLSNRTSLHPFGSLWKATGNVTLGDILQALPKNNICLKYFYVYLHSVHPFYPFLACPDAFEARLCKVLETKDDPGDIATGGSHLTRAALDQPVTTMAWYGLLFAVLACGCWFSDTDPASRVLTVRVFIASSFECLRFANIYVQPSMETVQAMLLVESIIANDSNPGVGWNLLASTVRQAQSIGLHVSQENAKRTAASVAGSSGAYASWQRAVDLDVTFSSAFDRPLVTSLPHGGLMSGNQDPYLLPDFPSKMHALNCIQFACQNYLSINQDASAPPAYSSILPNTPTRQFLQGQIAKVVQFEDRVAHNTVEVSKIADFYANGSYASQFTACSSTTIQQRLEDLVMALRLSYLKFELFRNLVVASSKDDIEPQLSFISPLVVSLENTLTSFIALKQLSLIASRSWDLLHRALSAAVTLAMFDRMLDSDRHRLILQKVVVALEAEREGLGEGSSKEDDQNIGSAPWRHGLGVLDFWLKNEQTIERVGVVDVR